MAFLSEHLAQIQAILTGITAILVVVHKADEKLIRHLAGHFASKSDIARLERKIDALLPRRSRLTAVKRDEPDEHDSSSTF